ncbi:MAG: NAD(+)/NADH kinase [bacterium]
MKLNQVLIVTKPHAGNTACANRDASRALDDMHAAVLAAVEDALSQRKIQYRITERENIPANARADLIVPLGGDGTFLAAAHTAGATPLLGVNAAPHRSVGFFCAARADTFAELIDRIMAGRLRPRELPLIEASLGGRPLTCNALNDVLFAGESPAETVRYRIKIGKRAEDHKSSGVWISAGPGSTAAIHSAGGKRMSIASKRLQYLVREPCPIPGHRYRLARGILPVGGAIEIISDMKCGAVYVDGHWHSHRVPRGSVLTCRVAKRSVSIFL